MRMTGTCLGMRGEILVSDLEHIRHATASDEVINLGGSTSKVSYCRVTLSNQNLAGDLSPVTGTLLQEFTQALAALAARHNIYI